MSKTSKIDRCRIDILNMAVIYGHDLSHNEDISTATENLRTLSIKYYNLYMKQYIETEKASIVEDLESYPFNLKDKT